MKKAFIFDLDGVIVDTAKFHYLAWRNLAKGIDFDFTEEQNEQFKGVSRVRSLEILLDMAKYTATQEQKEVWLVQKNEEYLKYIQKMDESEILPDVPRVLDYLIENQQGIALGSASKNARPILERVSLLDKFQAIVDGNDVTAAKPDPEVFVKGAQALKTEAKDCIVFEDSIAGIQAANAAGMISIGIGDPTVLHEAFHVFTNFTELSNDFLQELIAS
ncbi:beta-phosphoglucomutase [Dokdonia pacifica]|uniref:Beta-phosphoglucomutase n=1 Tax=Dokdonia pacifica TaxID=1627892 RepID=A0A238VTC9_9FLAO|nr:beta-phosphoglucomutase [Dokdonia pacifica]GGG17923.1 beta-phosphoglucomutase [Dokdonia pacifica]SNR37414.1 beta-phosphoglucomutase [Dokdonia pacifica]